MSDERSVSLCASTLLNVIRGDSVLSGFQEDLVSLELFRAVLKNKQCNSINQGHCFKTVL